ncbi:Protein of unknown function [Gryllus bimaculatus]|nr:Protein of unknown function [Gryllus bimaculatus]
MQRQKRLTGGGGGEVGVAVLLLLGSCALLAHADSSSGKMSAVINIQRWRSIGGWSPNAFHHISTKPCSECIQYGKQNFKQFLSLAGQLHRATTGLLDLYWKTL